MATTRNDLTPAERKDRPIFSGVLKYFPDALLEVAHLSKVGNDQHNPGQPLHWAKEKSTDEPDALMRHLLDAGTRDSDGERHSAKVAWRALAMLQREIEAEQRASDDQVANQPQAGEVYHGPFPPHALSRAGGDAAIGETLATKMSEIVVKELVWESHPDAYPAPIWSAQTQFGFYQIEEVSGSDSPVYEVRLLAHHLVALKDGLPEAKGAAQADYERRILSSVDTSALAAKDAEIEKLKAALESIRLYANDTLSGRVDGPDDRQWQREAVRVEVSAPA